MRQSSGFTIIELVVVMAILTILFGLAVPSYRDFQAGQALTQATQTLKTDLRFAQSQAYAGVKPCGSGVLRGWYIKFQTNSYTISTRCGDPPAPNITTTLQKTVNLPAGVIISPLPLDILFQPINKEVVFTPDASSVLCNVSTFTCASSANEATITLTKSPKAVAIYVRSTGDISEKQVTAPTAGPTQIPTPTPTTPPVSTPTPTVGPATPTPTPTLVPTATPTPTAADTDGDGDPDSTDCAPNDNRAFHGQVLYYSTPRVGVGGYDFNCDNITTYEYTYVNPGTSVNRYILGASCTLGPFPLNECGTAASPACGTSGYVCVPVSNNYYDALCKRALTQYAGNDPVYCH